MADGDENTYYLEEVSIDEDEDVEDDMQYEEVPLDEFDDDDDDDDDDDFGSVLQSIKKGEDGSGVTNLKPRVAPPVEKPKVGVEAKPTVVDDFIRNFLIKLKMARTLEAFNTEWYELADQGKLNEEDVGVVSDIYQRNENLDDQVKSLREEVLKSRSIAEKARGTWDKFRKERDFHRMHHRRVVQEKNVLIKDMKRLKKHYGTFEPALKAMREKYEGAMKDKMLMKLERDRMAGRLETVEAQLEALGGDEEKQTVPASKPKSKGKIGAKKGKDPKAKTMDKGTIRLTAKTHGKDSVLPPDDRVNPYLERAYTPLPVHSFSLRKTFKGHQMAISGIAIHPSKPIVATVSDDRTWKMWSIQRGELIMSGDGHKDWVAACDFHPGGSLLATGSGDGTVKLWNFVKATCEFTFTDHTQAVWDCKFHDTGDFLVSASMDHSAKVWDVSSQRCRQSLRGHVDSINSVSFQPYSNNIATASGDKTVSLWDIRSGLCVQTFYGHENAVLSTSFNYQGDSIVSSDSDGVVKVWDVRTVGERLEIATSENGNLQPCNDVKFDASGTVLTAALETGIIKTYGIANDEAVEELGYLDGHEGAVQAVVMDSNSGFLMSAGSDQTFRLWS